MVFLPPWCEVQSCTVSCAAACTVCTVQFYSVQWFWWCCIAFADLEWASLAAWVTQSLRQPQPFIFIIFILCNRASHFVKGEIFMKVRGNWKFRCHCHYDWARRTNFRGQENVSLERILKHSSASFETSPHSSP